MRIASKLPAEPLLTTLACFVEAIYFLYKNGGFKAQHNLWQMWVQRKLIVHCPSEQEMIRIYELMKQYQDIPMDFADATIVALAESTGTTELFTLDSHFYAYRINGEKWFTILQEPESN